ncbi:DNA glycosylase [Anoxynatronum sibiricum]|uniref:DNA-(apurinic or apyrimidinic site) lyase n=1 Tax=Anoxynatronum sibiricum TaxID=210623 RepID=A0ABU9VXH3_9CLOT
MRLVSIENGAAVLAVTCFSLEKTLTCGQCFRWRPEPDGSYTGVVKGEVLNARQEADNLILKPVSEASLQNLWIPYFDLQRDYEAVNRQLLQEAPWLAAPIETGTGIRLLQQDPWETTITFLFSANNHIPRITNSIEQLSRRYGTLINRINERDHHAFPEPEQLTALTLDDWKAVGAGYRAAYLFQTVRQWKACYRLMLDQQERDPRATRELLQTLPGVGPKVSACINLFGMGARHQFPVDVWVRRVVKSLWPEAPQTDAAIEAEALNLFGETAGYVQQLLFYHARLQKIK